MLTILTETIPKNKKKLLKKYWIKTKIFLATGKYKKYGGHYAVTRSLIEGLKKINYDFNYNPNGLKKITENVLVLSGIDALKQAIKLKKQGKIKKLLAGPNLVNLPSSNNIISNNAIDKYIVNSNWTKRMYVEDELRLKEKVEIWPAGINHQYWKPKKNKNKKSALLYIKNTDNNIIKYKNFLETKNFNTTVIEYGKYKLTNFRKILKKCSIAIFLTQTESQGIALMESWSMNIPTLVLEKNKVTIQDKKFNASSAPYLQKKKNGLFFKDYNNFIEKFNYWEKNKKIFSPRKWVIQNMTDKICAKKILTIIKKI